MKFAFRVDASVEMGTGHVMRCLTLASALARRGVTCHFLCRDHPGHLFELIEARGYSVHSLSALSDAATLRVTDGKHSANAEGESSYGKWLGVDWATDAAQTRLVLDEVQPNWLVVDHYALGEQWEALVKPANCRLMAIDDLADRSHSCDLLLDQNWFGVEKTTDRYKGRVSSRCTCLLGPKYALLGGEYSTLKALMPPRDGVVRRVLVFLGGSDPSNQTAKVLGAFTQPELSHLAVDVIVGLNHPDPQGIAETVANRPATSFHQGVSSLAGWMARADLMIGAGGATTWERMCLGLPSVVIGIADNQIAASLALMREGYISYLGKMNDVTSAMIRDVVLDCIESPQSLAAQSMSAQKLVSGKGASMVCEHIFSMEQKNASETPC